MKQTIKIKMLADIERPEIIAQGDWVDLRAATDIRVHGLTYIPLGVAMELPKGCEAYCTVRSSSPKKQRIWCANSFAVIDETFCGDNDQWHLIASTMDCSETTIHKNDRICQFRIQLSQKATVWQKLKWLFSSGIRLEFVDHLGNEDRNGIGSTGVN